MCSSDLSAVVVSLETPMSTGDGEGDGSALVDTIESGQARDPLQHTEEGELLEALAGAIRSLSERERILLSLYYEQELTMKEISLGLDVSESRVCQLHGRAVHRLRAQLVSLMRPD